MNSPAAGGSPGAPASLRIGSHVVRRSVEFLPMNRVITQVANSCRLWVISALLLWAAAPAGFAASPKARERGAVAFQTIGCMRCHSITGVGARRAPDLGSVALRRTPSQIRNQILHGGHGMPPWGAVLSNRQISDLVAFLSSCRSNEAPGCRTWQAPSAK